jgi:transposase InsO family protein
MQMDLFVVPAISFRLLYGLLILNHGRRQILWLGVTAHPTAEWMARQLTEACGWEQAPEYLVRDRDSVYGEIFTRRLRSMGIRDRPTAPRSPWQNGHAERLIGSLRRSSAAYIINMFGFDFRQGHAYVKWMEDNSDEARREVALLKLLGLFDRPATADCVATLGQAPAVPGLTEPLLGLAEDDWELSLTALRDAKLLTVNWEHGSGVLLALDAHPLLREYFARELRTQQPDLVAKADAIMQAARVDDANFPSECCTPRFPDAQGSWKETRRRRDIPKPTWTTDAFL